MESNALVTFNGSVRLPPHIMRKYNIKPGTRLQFAEKSGQIVLSVSQEPLQPPVIFLKNELKAKIPASISSKLLAA